MDTASHWKQNVSRPEFAALDRNLETDVVVIEGDVFSGPAESPLEKLPVPKSPALSR